ncbi:MAG: hypothetical protein H6922_04405 [Pseudomonadaceae bacterium]|nr:hypothetical protein [Pseudomonadaceae bacterium]
MFQLTSPLRRSRAQRGAMFGMDARIALIVAAILTAAGGYTLMSRLDRSKVEAAEMGAELLRDATLRYYQQIGINRMPDSLDELFQNALVADPSLKKDPWGNPWYYQHFSSNVSLEGTMVNVHYAVIFSGGKDGVKSSADLYSETDYAEWAPMGDDVGIKVSTRDIELKRKDEYVARAQLIVDKLEAAEASAFVEAQGACGGTEAPTWCTDQDGKNYTQFNFYPASTMDTSDGVVYYATTIQGGAPYQSGDTADMQRLMADLGLPSSYAMDPWGRSLNYHSNVSERADPPFSASICYSFNGANCFVR